MESSYSNDMNEEVEVLCDIPDHDDDDSEYVKDEDDISDDDRTVSKKRKKTGAVTASGKPVGRKKDWVWKYFQTVHSADSSEKMNQCIACKRKVSAQPVRMKSHLQKCEQHQEKNVTYPVLASALKSEATSIRDDVDLYFQTKGGGELLHQTEPKSGINSAANSRKQIILDQQKHNKTGVLRKVIKTPIKPEVVVSKTIENKKSLDLKLGKFIFSANLPFNIVENDEFKNLFQSLQPSYLLPSRQDIGGAVLDDVCSSAMKTVKGRLAGKKVTILQDGWNMNEEPRVISHCASTGTQTHFLDACLNEINNKTPNYCQILLENSIKSTEETYNCSVIGVVTDNLELLQRSNFQEKHSHLHIYGCNNHYLNLFGVEQIPTEMKIKIIRVQKYFSTQDFSSINEVVPPVVIPRSNRLRSLIECFESFLKNKETYVYMEISGMLTESVLEEGIKEILRDDTFHQQVSELVELLKPVVETLDKLQKENSTLAQAVMTWLQLNKIEKLENNYSFQQKKKLALTPLAVAAYMLHPNYRGADLPEELLEQGREWLSEKNPYFLIASVNLCLSNNEFYPRSMLDPKVTEIMEPSSWWKSLSTCPRISQDLITLAESLMLLPASTSGMGKCSSAMTNILTNKLNQISPEKTKKLCYVFRALARKDQM